ncbi:MAG: diguanylate cyclase [Planctomycetes bacterium]|nr:diguanylate cyclase [Planctomycetota bacterium]
MYGVKILLVEDDHGHQHLLSRALKSAQRKVEVETVATGQEALHAIQNRLFDCVLLDFNLPDLCADELLPALAKDVHSPPVVVISSSRDQDTVIKSMRHGSVDFLPKMEALDGDKLWRCVDAALGAHRRIQADRRKTERRVEQLVRRAEQDPLTRLSNRRCLVRLFEKCRVTRDRRGCVSVIMLDLDCFKGINDRHGHDYGDRVLRAVADVLRDCAGAEDVTCRYGGDEFVIIRPATSLAAAVYWAEALREKVAGLESRFGDQHVPVTVSIGVVNCATALLTPETIANADQAMYLAKQQGRNRVCTWEGVVFAKALEEAAVVGERSAARRLQAVLECSSITLGPAQQDHLITHAKYVSEMSVRLGRALELDAEKLERLRIAGLCHDLGKFLIPDSVLAKPAPLLPEETHLFSRHAEDGAEMAALLGVDHETSDYIRYHHTWFNGQDSVPRTPGRNVPLGARILAVADAFVAMTSERPYQPACSFSAAVTELRRCQGTQFDPDVADALPHALLAEVP